jgi:hypothetical protein
MEERAKRAKELLSMRYRGLRSEQVRVDCWLNAPFDTYH